MHPWAEGLFNEFDQLLPVDVCGYLLRMPENNSLLRGIQFATSGGLISGSYCWNGECTNCLVLIEEPSGQAKRVLACQTLVIDGLRIIDMSPELKADIGVVKEPLGTSPELE